MSRHNVMFSILVVSALTAGGGDWTRPGGNQAHASDERRGNLAESLRRFAEEAERLQQKYADDFGAMDDSEDWDEPAGGGVVPGMEPWLAVPAWNAHFSITRHEDTQTEAPRYRNETRHRWSATGAVGLGKREDRPRFDGEVWEGREPVAVRVRETGLTQGQDQRGNWFTLEERELTGDSHVDGDLQMVVDAIHGTYSVTFGVAAPDVEEVIHHGTGRVETRRRQAFNFSPAVSDQALPAAVGELSGRVEQHSGERVVVIEWSITPDAGDAGGDAGVGP